MNTSDPFASQPSAHLVPDWDPITPSHLHSSEGANRADIIRLHGGLPGFSTLHANDLHPAVTEAYSYGPELVAELQAKYPEAGE